MQKIALITDPATSFTPVVFRSRTIWLDNDTFACMSRFRNDRISAGYFYNDGPNIIDQFAIIGQQLVSGGAVTSSELGVFFNDPDLFGKWWIIPLDSEICPNPNWED